MKWITAMGDVNHKQTLDKHGFSTTNACHSESIHERNNVSRGVGELWKCNISFTCAGFISFFFFFFFLEMNKHILIFKIFLFLIIITSIFFFYSFKVNVYDQPTAWPKEATMFFLLPVPGYVV